MKATIARARIATLVSAIAAVCAANGCGDRDVGVGTGDGNATSAVVYAVLVRGPDSSSEYLVAADAVPSGVLDLADFSRALELPGGNFYAAEDAIFYGNFETKALQRYEIRPDLSIVLAGEVSFANYAVDFINEPPLFFSETSAYYFNTAQGQIITFNPTTMEITGMLDVPDVLRPGFTPQLRSAERVGDRYLATIRYTDADDFSQIAADSTIAIAIEDNPAQPVRFIRDERGAAAQFSFVDDQGGFYALADGEGGWLAITGLQDLPSPRLLRVPAGADAIDRSYLLDLGEILSTPGVNGLWPARGAEFVVQAWASDVDPANVLASSDDFWTAPYFEWVLVDARTGAFRRVDSIPRGAQSYALLRLRVDDQSYLQQYVFSGGFDTGRVELYALRDDASAEKVVETTHGDFRLLTRVRTQAR